MVTIEEILIEASKWSQERGAPYNTPLVARAGRIDLDDEEQTEEADDDECPDCGNAHDILKIKSEMKGQPLTIIYQCPCAHIWSKDLQAEEGEDEEASEEQETSMDTTPDSDSS